MSEPRFQPGEPIGDRFKIVRRLGEGGMAEVYEADDMSLGQRVALKFAKASGRQKPLERARLKKEIELARGIKHPNVCGIYDLLDYKDGKAFEFKGVEAPDWDGEPFLVMEMVKGQGLDTVLESVLPGHGGGLAPGAALEICVEILKGLRAIHGAHLTHLDVKPANIVIHQGSPVLVDFGLVSYAGDVATLEATPLYCAPEQALEGELLDARTDIYAVGLVLYELLSGKKAKRQRIHEEKTAETAWRVAPGFWIRPLEKVLPGIDIRLSNFVRKCLDFEMDFRHESAQDALDALESCRSQPMVFHSGETIASAKDWKLEQPFGYTANGELWIAVDELGRQRLFEFYREDRGGHLLEDSNWYTKLQAKVGQHAALMWPEGHSLRQAPIYLAFSYPSGGRLGPWSKAGDGTSNLEQLALEDRVELIKDLSGAIGRLHEVEEIHGRISGENIFVDAPTGSKPGLRIARFLGLDPSSGDEADTSTDVYDLGHVCCQIIIGRLTKRLPFDAVDQIPSSALREALLPALTQGGRGYLHAGELTQKLAALGDDSKPDPTWEPVVGDEVRRSKNWQLKSPFGRSALGQLWIAETSDGEDRQIFEFCRKAEARDLLTEKLESQVDLHNEVSDVIKGEGSPGLEVEPFYLRYEHGNIGTLADWLRPEGQDRPGRFERLRVAGQVASLLSQLHRSNESFGELKPSQIWLRSTGRGPKVRLAKLGITELHRELENPALYKPDSDSGTSSQQADLYALAALIFQLQLDDLQTGLRDGDWQGRVGSQPVERLIHRLLAGVDGPIGPEQLGTASQSGQREGFVHRVVMKFLSQGEQDPKVAQAPKNSAELLDEVADGLKEIKRLERQTGERYQFVRGLTAAVGVVAMLFLLFMVGAVFLWRIQVEKENTQQVAEFLQGVFEVADPAALEGLGASLTASQLLTWADHRLEGQFKDQPGIKGELEHRIGLAFQGLAEYERSETLLKSAVENLKRGFGPRSPRVAAALTALAETQRQLGHLDEASKLSTQAREMAAPRSDELLELGLLDARIQRSAGEREAAQKTLEDALEMLRSRTPNQEIPSSLMKAKLVAELGRAHFENEDLEQAKQRFEEALEIRWELVEDSQDGKPKRDPKIAALLNDLGLIAKNESQYVTAKNRLEEALKLTEKIQGADHPELAGSLINLGSIHERLCEYPEAEQRYREAVELFDRVFPALIHRSKLDALQKLAFLQMMQGEFSQAETEYRRLLELRYESLGKDDWRSVVTLEDLGRNLRFAGRFEESEIVLRQALQQWLDQDAKRDAAHVRLLLAGVLSDTGRYDEAKQEIALARGEFEEAEGPNGKGRGWVEEALGELFRAQGNPSAALEHFQISLDAFTALAKNPEQPDTDRVNKSRTKVARALLELPKPKAAEAEILAQAAIKSYKRYYASNIYPNHWRYAHARAMFGQARRLQGDSGGLQILEEAHSLLVKLRGERNEYARDAQAFLAGSL